MKSVNQLRQTLKRIDKRGFKAYRDISGTFDLGDMELAIDHVQADPFASPSRMRVVFQRDSLNLPEIESRLDRISLDDVLARRMSQQLRSRKRGSGSGKSGEISIDSGDQKIIERTACRITEGSVELRISAGLPAQGRSILGKQADTLLTEELPNLARAAVTLDTRAYTAAEDFIQTARDAQKLRSQLNHRGLVGFVANGAILPRTSGVSDRPLTGEVVPFEAPDSLAVDLELTDGSTVRGMGIPSGVTVIVGGGFHGKSTLLEAISHGVYNHVPGDGRERVVTSSDSVKIRAEDGRQVTGNDLSGFINHLPLGRSTDDFSTENASGSTSQAANILEAMEMGSQLLLMDEDTCATNFMIRDDVMRSLVPDASEPITPFIDRVRELYDVHGISTVLVMGGSGDYFGVADTVIWMNEYLPHDVTNRARSLVPARESASDAFPDVVERIPDPGSIDPTRRNRTRTRARGTEEIGFGEDLIDLRQVEQIVDSSQTRGIAEILVHARSRKIIDGQRTMREILDEIDSLLDRDPIDIVSPFAGHPGDFARPRRFEIGAAMNRLRGLRVRQNSNGSLSASRSSRAEEVRQR